MKYLLTITMAALIIISGLTACQNTSSDNSEKIEKKMLLITSDFGSVMSCKTYDELLHVANTMMSANPDIQTLDAAIPNLCYYKTSVGHYRSGKNMDALFEAGYDPLGVMVSKLKDASITVLAGIRMNDHHGYLEMWTPWDREHKEWSLGKDTGDRGWRAVGDLRQMDYSIEGVRAHRLAVIKEIVTKYDVDGIQLDFGRTAPFLSEPKSEKAKFMTQYIRDVRRVLDDASGSGNRKRLLLGAILPWDLDFCEREGLEINRWIQEELLAYVSPGEWFYSDWNIPLGGWVKLIKGTNCKLYPMICGNVSPHNERKHGKKTLLGDNLVLDGSKIRALAETIYSQGAEGIMFYNFYVGSFENYYPHLRDWTDPWKIPSMSRHYFFFRRLKYLPTENYTFGTAEAFDRFILQNVGDKAEYSFRFAGDLTASTAAFRFKLKNMTDKDEVGVTLNGSPVKANRILNRNHQSDKDSLFRFAIWETPASAPPLKLGENIVSVEMLKKNSDRVENIEVGEFEIQIKPFAKE